MAKIKRLRRSAASKEREAEQRALEREKTERKLKKLSSSGMQHTTEEEEEVYAVDPIVECTIFCYYFSFYHHHLT